MTKKSNLKSNTVSKVISERKKGRKLNLVADNDVGRKFHQLEPLDEVLLVRVVLLLRLPVELGHQHEEIHLSRNEFSITGIQSITRKEEQLGTQLGKIQLKKTNESQNSKPEE